MSLGVLQYLWTPTQNNFDVHYNTNTYMTQHIDIRVCTSNKPLYLLLSKSCVASDHPNNLKLSTSFRLSAIACGDTCVYVYTK